MVMAWSVPLYTQNIGAGIQIFGLLTDPAYPADVRALGHTGRACLLLAHGRWQDARTELDAAASLDAGMALEYRALLSATPFLPVARQELEAIRAELIDWNAGDEPLATTRITWVNVHDRAHRHLRLYLLGLLSARLGQGDAAIRYAGELGRLEGPANVTGLARDLVHGIRAQVALARGSPDEALEALEGASLQTWYQRAVSSLFYSQALERYTRAELLAAAGREREAMTWFSSFAAGSVRHLFYLAPSHLRRGAIYERLGQVERAKEHYRRVVELWSDADTELRPLVAQAEARLQALEEQGQP